MPRRESYLTDDEDDDLRRAGASGGGIPAWVWVVGGGGILAVVVVVGLGFAMFTRREAAVRHEVARAEMMRVEADRAEAMAPRGNRPARPVRPGDLALTPLDEIAKEYRDDPVNADARFKGQRLRVGIEVRKADEGWVGTVASIGRGLPRGRVPNVYFLVPDVRVADGAQVVIEGTCAGLSPDPTTGVRLTFTDGRLVEE